VTGPTGDSGDALHPPTEPPRVIRDRYEVVRTLGAGSSGRTLLCTDLRDGRQVAVKELHLKHAEDWKHLELFEREARMLARLDHPGIPKVLDFSQPTGDSGTLQIVQEYIDGPSLQQRMEQGPMLGQREIRDLALGVLDVLEYLHGRLPPVLHRDIKPSNVLLRPDGRPALVDFGGICVGWRPPGSAGTTVVGTFGYMPPEQLVGQGGPTSDLYALGATLLHVVTGRPPSEFPFDSGRIEVPDNLPVDPALARLIEALLRPAPRDRPQTAAEARRLLDGAASPALVPAARRTASVTEGAGAHVAVRYARVSITGGDGPRFVDLGDPPRDPRGHLRDVYRNLIHPLFPARLLWPGGTHGVWVAAAGLISVVTLGMGPVLYSWGAMKRRRTYEALFRYGHFTTGVVRGVQKGGAGVYATYKYEFVVGDALYVAFMEQALEMTHYWSEGDEVPVLYDPADPSRCCFVYR